MKPLDEGLALKVARSRPRLTSRPSHRESRKRATGNKCNLPRPEEKLNMPLCTGKRMSGDHSQLNLYPTFLCLASGQQFARHPHCRTPSLTAAHGGSPTHHLTWRATRRTRVFSRTPLPSESKSLRHFHTPLGHFPVTLASLSLLLCRDAHANVTIRVIRSKVRWTCNKRSWTVQALSFATSDLYLSAGYSPLTMDHSTAVACDPQEEIWKPVT